MYTSNSALQSKCLHFFLTLLSWLTVLESHIVAVKNAGMRDYKLKFLVSMLMMCLLNQIISLMCNILTFSPLESSNKFISPCTWKIMIMETQPQMPFSNKTEIIFLCHLSGYYFSLQIALLILQLGLTITNPFLQTQLALLLHFSQ